jgi:hypothetical protein
MKDGAKNTRTIFVDSDEHWHTDQAKARIHFPNYPFSACCDETMRLTLLQLDMHQVWTDINATNDRFYLYNPDYVAENTDQYYEFKIAHASYADNDALRSALESALLTPKLPDNVTPILTGIAGHTVILTSGKKWSFVVTFAAGKFNNAFFTTYHVKSGAFPAMVSTGGSTNTIAESFAHYSDTHEILGIVPSRSAAPVASMIKTPPAAGITTFQAPFALRKTTLETIYVRASLNSGNYQSHGHDASMVHNTTLTESHIFAKVNSAPGVNSDGHLFWEDSHDLYQLNLQMKHLEHLEIWLTDAKGRLLTNIVGPGSVSALSFRCVLRWDHMLPTVHNRGHVATLSDIGTGVNRRSLPQM